MSGNPIAWLHEPTGNVFKDGECQELIAVWQKQFAETIPAEEIAADFIPLVRAYVSSQAEIERLRTALAQAQTYISCQCPVVGFARKAQSEVLTAIASALSGSKE